MKMLARHLSYFRPHPLLRPRMATAVDDADSAILLENVGHRLELRDINIRFPEGQLSVIIGPTASRKTALLVCCLIL